MAKASRGGRQHKNSTNDAFEAFLAMSDDKKAYAIVKATWDKPPDYLGDSSLQRLTYNLGLDDRPEVVNDREFNKLEGYTMYRTVNEGKLEATGEIIPADKIAEQIRSGRFTRYSGEFSSEYGRGIYFGEGFEDSAMYGKTRGDITKTAIVAAKLNKNARVIDYYDARVGAETEIQNHTKFGMALQSCDSRSRPSIYALRRGYNVIQNGKGTYYSVLDRRAITVRKRIEPKP